MVGDGDGDRLRCGEQPAARIACSRQGYLVVVVVVGVGGGLVVRGDRELRDAVAGLCGRDARRMSSVRTQIPPRW